MSETTLTEQERYKVYRALNGKCHHCSTRLSWEAFEVRGLGGGWVLMLAPKNQLVQKEESDVIGRHQALCYRCSEFEDRGKGGRLFLTEE